MKRCFLNVHWKGLETFHITMANATSGVGVRRWGVRLSPQKAGLSVPTAAFSPESLPGAWGFLGVPQESSKRGTVS